MRKFGSIFSLPAPVSLRISTVIRNAQTIDIVKLSEDLVVPIDRSLLDLYY
jgi:hypothetical protein